MRTLLVAFSSFLLVGLGHASTISFSTPSGSSIGGENVGAAAIFNITGTNAFTITLSNTIAGLKDAGQLLTDLEFTFKSPNLTMVSSNGELIVVNGNGSITDQGSSATGWGFGAFGGPNSFSLCAICGGGISSSGPSQGILGPGPYTGANGSIAGNGPHNPFLASGATFSFTTSATLSQDSNPFSNVVFSFSTSLGNNVNAVPPTNPIPEPVTMMLAGAGLIGLGMLRRFRRS